MARYLQIDVIIVHFQASFLGTMRYRHEEKGRGRAERVVVLGNRAILHRVVVDYINSVARSTFLIQPAIIYHLD